MKNKIHVVSIILDNMLMLMVVSLIVLSAIAFFIIHVDFFTTTEYQFSFTDDGLSKYLLVYEKFKALFMCTVVLAVAYLGLLKFKVATDVNKDKVKQDRFSEWKTTLDTRMLVIEKSDPYMRSEFLRIRFQLFSKLYDSNFKIENRKKMIEIFIQVFDEQLIDSFETQNEEYNDMAGVYQNDSDTYSFESFRYLFLGSVEETYDCIAYDLFTLYISKLSKKRKVDPQLYEIFRMGCRHV